MQLSGKAYLIKVFFSPLQLPSGHFFRYLLSPPHGLGLDLLASYGHLDEKRHEAIYQVVSNALCFLPHVLCKMEWTISFIAKVALMYKVYRKLRKALSIDSRNPCSVDRPSTPLSHR